LCIANSEQRYYRDSNTSDDEFNFNKNKDSSEYKNLIPKGYTNAVTDGNTNADSAS
jgi:hypothetical protein